MVFVGIAIVCGLAAFYLFGLSWWLSFIIAFGIPILCMIAGITSLIEKIKGHHHKQHD